MLLNNRVICQLNSHLRCKLVFSCHFRVSIISCDVCTDRGRRWESRPGGPAATPPAGQPATGGALNGWRRGNCSSVWRGRSLISLGRRRALCVTKRLTSMTFASDCMASRTRTLQFWVTITISAADAAQILILVFDTRQESAEFIKITMEEHYSG